MNSWAAKTILAHRYGGELRPVMPNRSVFGSQEIRSVPAPGIDTGSVHLQPLSPDPLLSSGAEDGIEAGFAEFFSEYSSKS